eukprot:3132551-Pyramimonas_sp.AAC.1
MGTTLNYKRCVVKFKNSVMLSPSPTSSPSPPTTSAAGFDRDIDATIIRVMASKLVESSAVQQIMSEWVTSCGVKLEYFSITSSEQVAKQFSFEFSGAAGPAARRVSRVLGAQRLAPGQWKCFE